MCFDLKRHHIRKMRIRTKECFNCNVPGKKFFFVADIMRQKIGFFFVASVLLKLNLDILIHINIVELGRVEKKVILMCPDFLHFIYN